MAEQDWQVLEGLNPDTTEFPVRAEIGSEKVVVLKLGDEFRAIQRRCPHQNTDLSRGLIVGDGTLIRCALHAYTFKLSDGKGVNCPGYSINIFEVSRDGDVLRARRVEVS